METIIDKNIKEILDSSFDLTIIVDEEKNVVYTNNLNKLNFDKLDNISQIEHLFSFDICILDADEIMTYTPLKAAFVAKESFCTNCNMQVSEFEYKNIFLKSFYYKNYKIFVFKDYTDSLLASQYSDLRNKFENLKSESKQYLEYKQKAETFALRTSLVNSISGYIRELLDIETIIKTVIDETAKTLAVHKGYFAFFDKKNNSFLVKHFYGYENQVSLNIDDSTIKCIIETDNVSVSSVIEEGELRPRIVAPVVYNKGLVGVLVFYHKNNQRLWSKEEISLIKGISSQLATAINQSRLFEKINNQKKDLEKALVELKDTQTQLIHSEKMASLGQLVAGVAHEINTPLGTINSNNNIFDKSLNKIKDNLTDEKALKILNMLFETSELSKEAISRINKIVKSLKNFARLDEANLKKVSVKDGIVSTLALIKHEIKDRIEIIENYSDIPELKCYPDILNQVFMNILVNAYQSIEGKGTITIQTRYDNKNVYISISDTGKGIKEKDLKKIFDPGYTTKGVGVGTGLGLSIVHKIIDKHKGKINVSSKECIGTTFEIILPTDLQD